MYYSLYTTLILYQSIVNHYLKEIYMYRYMYKLANNFFLKTQEILATRPYDMSPILITCEWTCVWDSPFITKKIITNNTLVMTFRLWLIKILFYNDLCNPSAPLYIQKFDGGVVHTLINITDNYIYLTFYFQSVGIQNFKESRRKIYF